MRRRSRSRFLLLDAVFTALYIWQVDREILTDSNFPVKFVFMFCWVFLNFLSISCQVVAQLTTYLEGTAVTSCLTFLLTFSELVTGDNKVYSWLEAGQDRQQALAKIFQSLQCLLVFIHLFWMLFGSVNVLPTALQLGFLIR